MKKIKSKTVRNYVMNDMVWKVEQLELLINGLMAVNALVHDDVDLSQFIHK